MRYIYNEESNKLMNDNRIKRIPLMSERVIDELSHGNNDN
jgi:hypothetical protein